VLGKTGTIARGQRDERDQDDMARGGPCEGREKLRQQTPEGFQTNRFKKKEYTKGGLVGRDMTSLGNKGPGRFPNAQNSNISAEMEGAGAAAIRETDHIEKDVDHAPGNEPGQGGGWVGADERVT